MNAIKTLSVIVALSALACGRSGLDEPLIPGTDLDASTSSSGSSGGSGTTSSGSASSSGASGSTSGGRGSSSGASSSSGSGSTSGGSGSSSADRDRRREARGRAVAGVHIERRLRVEQRWRRVRRLHVRVRDAGVLRRALGLGARGDDRRLARQRASAREAPPSRARTRRTVRTETCAASRLASGAPEARLPPRARPRARGAIFSSAPRPPTAPRARRAPRRRSEGSSAAAPPEAPRPRRVARARRRSAHARRDRR